MTKARTNADNVTADIAGITAGTGITGGGTSGTVTVTNSMATAIDAAGDLIYGTGADTFTRLAVGSTGNLLTVAGGVPTWAAPAGGKVLQVVSSTSTTTSSHNSATLTNTPLTVTITPTSATSKIYVTAFHSGSYIANFASSVTNVIGGFALTRDGTQRQYFGIGAESFSSSNNKIVYSPVLFSLLDDPATTSAVVYRTQSACIIGTAIITGGGATQVDSIVAMEIGA